MRETLEQHHGTSYGWVDAKSGTAYWLEDVELNGTRTSRAGVCDSGASTSTSSIATPATSARSATMAEMSLASAQVGAASDSSSATGPVFIASRAVPRFATAQAATAQRRQTQFGLAAGAAVKLALRSEGW